MKAKALFTIFFALLFTNPTVSVLGNEKLPDGIKWLTNDTDPVFASPNAKKGGTYRSYISSFPLTIRHVGPDSNGTFAGPIRGLNEALVSTHPNTENLIPGLATHWAYDDDKRTMYFKIDKSARWSDGEPITADDWVYALKFMRSKNIIDPFYNNFYTDVIEKVTKYDDHTIAISATKPRAELERWVTYDPLPEHFYGDLPKDFVRRFNWKIAPSSGAYQIDEIKKGKSITLKRKKNWWGKDKRYYKGRFNVDKIRYIVIRDIDSAFEFFKNNRLDSFPIILPSFWHQKANDMDVYKNGYVKKIWFYNDIPQPAMGFWLNQGNELFKEKNLRYAFAHSINMEKMLKGILRNDYGRLHSHYVGYGKYSNSKIKAREFDIEKVQALMKESGWERGRDGIWTKDKRRFSVVVNYSAEHHTQRLVVLKEEAKKAGVELILKKLDGSSSWKMNLEKRHVAAWTGFGTGLRPAFWQHYHSSNAFIPNTNNFTNTADPELDKMIEAYRVSLEIDERVELSLKIQEKLYEIGAFVPAYFVGYTREAYWRWWKLPEVPGTKLSDFVFEELGTAVFWYDADVKKETMAAMKKKQKFKPETVIDTTFKAK